MSALGLTESSFQLLQVEHLFWVHPGSFLTGTLSAEMFVVVQGQTPTLQAHV